MAILRSGQGYSVHNCAQMAAWIALQRTNGGFAEALDERMADGLCAAITRDFPRASRIGILVGRGGNGRQAQALVRRYQGTGIEVTTFSVDERAELDRLRRQDVLIDGLIGTGLEGPLRDPYRGLAECAQASGRPIVAIDGPTGLDLDKGSIVLGALRATCTLFCAYPKIGGLTGAGREVCGVVGVIDSGLEVVPPEACAYVPSEAEVAALVPVRPQHAHKGTAGTCAIWGGDIGMPGAVRLAAEGAYRAGAGLVISWVHARHAAVLAASLPELIAFAAFETEPPLLKAQWLLVGSGLGRRDWGHDMWARARSSQKPLLVDGDALYWLALEPEARSDWILTPHEAEAARLLGVHAKEVAHDRPGACRELYARYGGVCVLKGAGTLITSAEGSWLCPFGHPGMATAGMGDVLAGVIAGLAVQGLTACQAARLGVFLHAEAGDRAALTVGPRGLLASDLIRCLPAAQAHLCSSA